MQIDPMPYILGAALLAFPLGYFASWMTARRKIRRIGVETWNQARIFYTHRAEEGRGRP
jgi:hypothetical protein